MLNDKENQFLNSIRLKIKEYSIPVSMKQVLQNTTGQFLETTYNNKSKELVDVGAERFLCSKSPFYFIQNYCYISVPNMGIIPFHLYYFQKELLKEMPTTKRLVTLKGRQCLTENNYVNTDKGCLSIKDVKIGDKVETLVNGQLVLTPVFDSFCSGEKEICRIFVRGSTSIECTLDHKVFTQRGWVEAGDLTIKDKLVSVKGYETIKEIFKPFRKAEVYDITTGTSDFLANGLLVHNCGLSTVTSFYCLWRALFFDSESIAIVSKKKDAAQDFIAKMKVTLDYLPVFLRQKIVSSNMSSIRFGNTSEIKSEARSPNAGRSSTLSLLVMDEAAFYGTSDMAEQIVASAMPTLTRTGGSIFIISTPNGSTGAGKFYFEQVQQLQLQGNTDKEKLVEIDWFEVPDMPNIYPHKGYNHVLDKYIKLDYYNNPQTRKEMKTFFKPIQENWVRNDWLKSQHVVLGEAKFRQEILHDFVTMGNAVFNNEILSRVLARTKEPIIKDVLGNSTAKGLWIWKTPLPGRRYIIAGDVASGTSADYSTCQVFDVENYEQVAEFREHISTPSFSIFLKKLCNYYNQAYLVIESNSIGEAVFNAVYYDEYEPYRHVFKQEKTKNGITRMTGWITNTSTRKLIVNEIIDWLSVDDLWNELKVYSTRLHTELCTWIWKENGKAEHSSGKAHDDIIIALGLALHLRNKAISTGTSFIVDEQGKLITSDTKGNLPYDEKKDLFGILMDDDDDIDKDLNERYGVAYEDYKWITK